MNDDMWLEVYMHCDPLTQFSLSFTAKLFNHHKWDLRRLLVGVQTVGMLEWGISVGCWTNYPVYIDIVYRGRY